MRRSRAEFSESEASNHTPLADFITTTSELRFSVHTGSGRAIRERLAAQFLSSNFEKPFVELLSAVALAIRGGGRPRVQY
jgi:hypothetical protein